METKATQRQINRAELESERVININRIMKKVHQASDFLYESMMDRERAYSISACNKLIEYSEEIKNNIEKFTKDGENH